MGLLIKSDRISRIYGLEVLKESKIKTVIVVARPYLEK